MTNPFLASQVTPTTSSLPTNSSRSFVGVVQPPSLDPARKEVDGETSALRAQLRDLVVVLALPALWRDRDPARIASDLLEVLASLLRLESAFVRFSAESSVLVEHRRPLT